ncbi:NMD3 family protein [Candidatus Gugararchaeum adminiculabundum]|nr:NMD3 family protein [Candidatus Gugararchaeum adminiculabundum]
MKKICPKCGASSENTDFFGSFCSSCYLKKTDLKFPKKFLLETCKLCGRMLILSAWADYDEEKIHQLVASRCKGPFESVGVFLGEDSVKLTFNFKKGGSELSVKKALPLERKVTTCPNCSRKSGGYFEAIIQLRGNRNRFPSMQEKLKRILEKSTFISKIEELPEGIDLYVGGREDAKKALGLLGLKPSSSNTLAGERQGQRLYRTTYCVRL